MGVIFMFQELRSKFFSRCGVAPAGARQFQDPSFLRAVQSPLPGRANFRILAFCALCSRPCRAHARCVFLYVYMHMYAYVYLYIVYIMHILCIDSVCAYDMRPSKYHSSGRPEADWEWGSGGRSPPARCRDSPCGLITQVCKLGDVFFCDML